MKKNYNIAEHAFAKFLREKGCSDVTPYGKDSTIPDYIDRLRRICTKEGFSTFDELAINITHIVKKYSSNGSESEYGQQSNGSNIKALQFFEEFIIGWL